MSKVRHVIRLLELLAQETRQPLNYSGFKVMSEYVGKVADDETDISPKYLDDVYRAMNKKLVEGRTETRTKPKYLDIIARFLNFKGGFNEFSFEQEIEISDTLKSCEGFWWSYVRANNGDFIFKAPVRIYQDEKLKEMYMELKGRERTFCGKLILKGNCMTGFLESGTNKRLGLIFQLGDTRIINTIQGVFCGISTYNEPIAGREILIRETNIDYNEMVWCQYNLHDERIDVRIRDYFSLYNKNCIKITQSEFEL